MASRSRISLRVRRLRRISAVGVRSSRGDAPSRIGASKPFARISRRDILGCSSLIVYPFRCPVRSACESLPCPELPTARAETSSETTILSEPTFPSAR